LEGYPKRGEIGVADPTGSVWIENESGEVVVRRDAGREAFPAKHWDALHFIYFIGYALRNYLSAPFFLNGVGSVRSHGQGRVSGQPVDRVEVTFPPEFVTHCRKQVFHFNEAGLLVRHDYTAEPLARFPAVAHLCNEHKTFAGLTLPT